MKKLVIIFSLSLFALFLPHKANAQLLGVKGGIYTTHLSDLLEHHDISQNLGFQAGLAYNVDISPSFVIQPEVLYVQQKGKIKDGEGHLSDETFKLHYIQVPVNFQLGINLVLIRPFFQVSPYLQYALGSDFSGSYKMEDIRRLNGGIGVGGGVDLWKFQLNIRYYWGFNKIGKNGTGEGTVYENLANSRGRSLEFSVAMFF